MPQSAGAAGQDRPAPSRTGFLYVEDSEEPRVRVPADLLRCCVTAIEIAVLAMLGTLARATASGVQVDLVGATRRLPGSLLAVAAFLAHLALLALPLLLAVRLLVRRQFRRLGEAAATGLLAAGIVVAANLVLRQPTAAGLYLPLVSGHAARHHVQPLDGYLTVLIAYTTIIGLSGRPRWRGGLWAAIGFYALASLASAQTTVLAVLISLLLGSFIGSAVRYIAGTRTDRPTAEQIAAALSTADAPVTEMRRIWDTGTETRRYAARTRGGGRLDVTVFDRDQQAADLLYRLYRRLRLRTQVSRSAPLTVERAVERRALLSYATADAGVPTPRLRALVRAGPEAAVLASEHQAGITLAELPRSLSDADLARIWDTVLRLHSRRVTHRALTADRILLAGNGAPDHVVLLDPGNGDVAATDLQLRLDVAQLLTELALHAGPRRAIASALAKFTPAELAAVVPLLQPVVLHRSTRAAVRHRKDLLPELRKQVLAAVPGEDVPPVQVERFRARTVISLIAAVAAGYVLIGQVGRLNLGIIRHADWRWTLAALGLSAATYLGAAWSLTGFVLERLNLARTAFAQLAASFVTLVTPAAVGGVALNLRYLRKAGVAPADAAASVGVSQVVALALHTVLLVIFAALAGTSQSHSLRLPGWVYIALAVLAAAVLVMLALPVGRRLVRARLGPAVGQLIPRLLDVAGRPAKLAEGVGGAFLVTAGYVLCLLACTRAMGGTVPLASVAVVYLTGSAIGSAVPTPGGLGAVEAALSAGLTAAALPGATAVSAVLLFRLITFWLPVPLGWGALQLLRRRDAL
jgi:uncharacterized membrane protein YbhN (UPF0104 family)/tRNA A-37 threonylcarbamoyl transferase component Bud32